MLCAVLARWHVPDPLAEVSRRWSPYSYCYNNPLQFTDPDGMRAEDFRDNLDADPMRFDTRENDKGDTDFLDKNGTKIAHVEDGSNAVFQLKGTDKTNEYFEFTGFNNQGGEDIINTSGAITGAQDYVTNNYSKCNQAVNFVGRTYESAVENTGSTVDNIKIVNGNNLASGITKSLASKMIAEKSVSSAQASAGDGNLVVGANGGHVVTMTTESFNVTHYNNSGQITSQKTISGGKTANVNGTPRPTNIGPNQRNSFQNPAYSGMKWYSFPIKK